MITLTTCFLFEDGPLFTESWIQLADNHEQLVEARAGAILVARLPILGCNVRVLRMLAPGHKLPEIDGRGTGSYSNFRRGINVVNNLPNEPTSETLRLRGFPDKLVNGDFQLADEGAQLLAAFNDALRANGATICQKDKPLPIQLQMTSRCDLNHEWAEPVKLKTLVRELGKKRGELIWKQIKGKG